MSKNKLLLYSYIFTTSVLTQGVAHANDVTCLGFKPEAYVVCNDHGIQHIHAYQEPFCGAGRDGELNDGEAIRHVEGPIWTDDEAAAQVVFDYHGQTVTLHGCTQLE